MYSTLVREINVDLRNKIHLSTRVKLQLSLPADRPRKPQQQNAPTPPPHAKGSKCQKPHTAQTKPVSPLGDHSSYLCQGLGNISELLTGLLSQVKPRRSQCPTYFPTPGLNFKRVGERPRQTRAGEAQINMLPVFSASLSKFQGFHPKTLNVQTYESPLTTAKDKKHFWSYLQLCILIYLMYFS